MKKLSAGIITTAGAILLLTALSPLAMANESTTAEQAASAVESSLVLDTTQEVVGHKEGGGLIPIGCLPGTPLTCADILSSYNSTCSCSSTLQPVKCRSCDRGKGQVLQTTCTVRFTCTSEPCDIQPNIIRTSLSCAT